MILKEYQHRGFIIKQQEITLSGSYTGKGPKSKKVYYCYYPNGGKLLSRLYCDTIKDAKLLINQSI